MHGFYKTSFTLELLRKLIKMYLCTSVVDDNISFAAACMATYPGN